MCEREALGAVSERHRSLAWRVERREDIDEKSDQAEMSGIAPRDKEAESGGKQRPGHLRECEKK